MRTRKFQPGDPATKERLDRLLDPNRRVQPGEIDLHIVDKYGVLCIEGRYEIFLDMYHCADAPTTLAPPGFSLAR
jgi:hypothetical protein